MTQSPLLGLFDSAKAQFEALRAELAWYGLEIGPNVQLVDGQGLLCFYDLDDGNIHLSLPDPTQPIGVFQAEMFRSVLDCADEAELAQLIRLLLPGLLAHELGHFFRHQRGKFGTDLWFEEQVANQFAAALTEHRLAPADRDTLTRMMRRTLEHLAPKVGSEHIAVASYLDPLQALGASGVLGKGTVRSLELLQGLFTVSPESILRDMPRMPADVVARLEQRQGTIAGFNEDYSSGLARYIYFQFGWMLIELESPEQHYVDEVARRHLGQELSLLAAIERTGEPTADEVASCHRAYLRLIDRSPVASRHFFKRYRSLLLDKLAVSLPSQGGVDRRFDVDARRVVESQDEDDGHTLDFLAVLAPTELKALFPTALAESARTTPSEPAPELAFRSETDARLWRLVGEGASDPAAAATLAFMEQLHASEVYRALPAELIVHLTHHLYRVRVPEGETLMWRGSANDDVFILVRGALEVLIGDGPKTRCVGTVSPGALLGEMAFVTGDLRSATLRATCDAECLVLRSATLKLLAYESPALMMQMARVLARRLAAQSASA